MLGVGFLIIIFLVVSAGSTLLQARHSLELARHEISALQDNQRELTTAAGRQVADRQLGAAIDDANRASGTLHASESLRLLAKVPFLGHQVTTTQALAGDVATTAQIGRTLLHRVDAVTASSSGTSVSLAELSSLRNQVNQSSNDLLVLERPTSGLLPPLASAQSAFNAQINKVVGRLDSAARILRYLEYFLGGDGPRTYLLAGENQSEMRDQGAVLSLAQVHGSNGSVSVDTPVSIDQYPLDRPAPFPLGPGMQQVFGIDAPTQTWQSANMTADFPWTGGDLSAMYLQATGVPVDGVIAVDVHSLSAVLRFSGPISIPGISVPISSGNVAPLLLNQLYAANPTGNQTARKDLLSAVATAAFSKLRHTHLDLAAFAHTLSDEIAGRHLLFYDAKASNEAILRSYGASGAIDTTSPGRSFHLAVENASANKVDVFLSTSIHQSVIVDPTGSATVITRVTVHNGSPTSRTPTYQLGPNSSATRVPGEFVGIAYLWGPRGSQQPSGVAESGLVVTAHNLDVLPGSSQTVTYVAVVPRAVVDGHVHLRWIPQSTISPQRISISLKGLGGAPAPKWAMLDRPTDFVW
jgi:hypothetical protein